MDPHRWNRLWSLFHRASERSLSGRGEVLAQAARSDPSLAREVGELLGAHDGEGPLDRTETHTAGTVRNGDAREAPPPEDLSGSRIGPYLLERRLGEGGMGVVYRGLQESPVRRPVAVKLVRPELGSREALARFEFERRALALMDDPRIATLLDAGAAPDGRPFFVMELAEGEAITEFCDRRQLSLRERIGLMAEVCEAVQHAHQKGVLHRDLKPSNVLVLERDGRPRVKVIDFGIAKALTPEAAPEGTLGTRMGTFLGTPDYMSPEQLRNAADVDTRSDVYALGMLLYRLLVGLLPHEREEGGFDAERLRRRVESGVPRASARVRTAGARQDEIARQRRSDPGALVRELRGELDWVLGMALDPDRDRRYGSASDLASDLRRHLAGQPVVAAPPSLAYRARKFVARHRGAVASAAAFVLLLAGSVVILAAQRSRLAEALEAAREANRRGAEQLARAESVSSFLARLFEGAGPTEARGRAVTARELLEAGDKRLDQELRDQPAARAALLATLGEVWSDLGVHDRAERSLAESLALRRQLADTAGIADSAMRLGTALVATEQWERAEALIREAIALRRQTLGPRHPLTAQALSRLGRLDMYRSRYAEAEASLADAYAVQSASLGRDDPALGETRSALGSTLSNLGKLEQAEGMLRANLESALRSLGEDHPDVATRQMNLAGALKRMDKPAEAEQLFRQALAARRRIYEPGHLEVAIAANNLAILLDNLGQEAEAERLFREALAIFEQRLGRRSEQYANTLGNLASLRSSAGDVEGSLKLAREALATRIAVLGEKHPRVGINLQNMGWDLGRAGRREEALASFRRSLPILRETLGPRHTTTGIASMGFGWQLCESGRTQEGLESLAEASSILSEASPAGSWRTGQALALRGRCLQLAGRVAEARPILEQGVALMTTLPADDQRRREAEAFLAQARTGR